MKRTSKNLVLQVCHSEPSTQLVECTAKNLVKSTGSFPPRLAVFGEAGAALRMTPLKFRVFRDAMVIMFFFAMFFFVRSAYAGTFDSFERGDLLRINPPNVTVKVLKNGIRCFVLEDHTLPMARIKVISKAGGIYDPADKVGLAAITGMLMRSGGAGGEDPEGFDAAVDDIGASLSSSIGSEMGEAELVVLSSEIEKGLYLLFDMLFKPGFDRTRFKVAKAKIEEALRRDDDDPSSLAGWHIKQFIYGAKSPWARRPDKGSLARISLDDVRDAHKNYFKTQNLIIAATGDFKSSELLELIRKITADAPGGEVKFPDVEAVQLEFKPAVDEVVRPLTQSFVRMGHLGIKRHNPDKYALTLMGDILGASNFKSRLMEDIRTKRGMAYSIWSDFTLGTDYGMFLVGVDTKSSQAGQVIELIKEHIKKLAGDGVVTESELEFARRSVLSKLVFEFDSASKVVDRRAKFYFHGYPDNYWQIFRDKISKVSAKDVGVVAKKYLHPDGLKIVIVGPRAEGLK